MFTDLDRLSTNSLTRTLQLRVIMSMSSIYECVLNYPNLIDLVKLEDDLISSMNNILTDIYKPLN